MNSENVKSILTNASQIFNIKLIWILLIISTIIYAAAPVLNPKEYIKEARKTNDYIHAKSEIIKELSNTENKPLTLPNTLIPISEFFQLSLSVSIFYTDSEIPMEDEIILDLPTLKSIPKKNFSSSPDKTKEYTPKARLIEEIIPRLDRISFAIILSVVAMSFPIFKTTINSPTSQHENSTNEKEKTASKQSPAIKIIEEETRNTHLRSQMLFKRSTFLLFNGIPVAVGGILFLSQFNSKLFIITIHRSKRRYKLRIHHTYN